ncbi:MAG: haloacid dehalogenase [Lentisphaerae bacterium GWF2_52_8]|nr:MAG: haloacid dehalogenase [Lentisphaerae bacterium GWF2_52_8]
MDHIQELKELPKKHEFFIGFDSDGCIFDTMEIKQKECFCPNFIKHFKLQAASKYAREVWEFVNLYSKTRGCNRFNAVKYALDFIRERKVFADRGIRPAAMKDLEAWLKVETKLGNPALKAKLAQAPTDELKMLYAWSIEVNESIEKMVFGIPPFPGVKEVLDSAKGRADMIVVSQTPLEALTREWKENKIDHYLNFIAGQEHGTKTEHLKYAAVGKYSSDKILMVGDANGDLKAASSNGVLFYPVIPGREEESWAKLANEALAKFFDGTYKGAYQDALLAEFDKALPAIPPW